MTEACDKCAGTAHYQVASPHGARLTFCATCSTALYRRLAERGWLFTPLTRIAPAPQAAGLAS